jgi:chromosomal replication initiation ATPase DnaA
MMKTIEQIWKETLELLQRKMSRSSFETWIKGLTIQRFDVEKKTVTIHAENEFTRQWLETRLKQVLEDAIEEITGDRYAVSFSVKVKTYVRYSMEQVPTRIDPQEEQERENRNLLLQVLQELQMLHQRLDRMEGGLGDIKKEIKNAGKLKRPPWPISHKPRHENEEKGD